MDKIGLVKFEYDNKKYEIYLLANAQTDILLFTVKTIR